MRNLMLFFVFLQLISTAINAQWGGPKTPNDTLVSTRVLPNGDVQFSVYAPEAKTVGIAGDIVPWGVKIEAKKSDPGIWTMIVPNVKAGTYRYNFTIDGVKVFDPKAKNASETSALIDITPSGENDFFALRKNIPHGAISQVMYYSKTTQSLRRMHVWTPSGYSLNTSKLPVLYLLHGGGDNDMAWPNVGRAGWIMDNLLAEGKCEKMLVVMPDGGIDTRMFVKDLMNDIIPYVENNFLVYKEPGKRAIAGLSMGGLEVLESFMGYPDQFAYAHVMSSGWFANSKEMYENGDKRLAEIAPILNKSLKLLLFTQGGPEDIAFKNGKEMLKVFDKNGVKYEFSEMPGGHSWLVWRNDLKNLAPRLFK